MKGRDAGNTRVIEDTYYPIFATSNLENRIANAAAVSRLPGMQRAIVQDTLRDMFIGAESVKDTRDFYFIRSRDPRVIYEALK